jgi:hypothetical protein
MALELARDWVLTRNSSRTHVSSSLAIGTMGYASVHLASDQDTPEESLEILSAWIRCDGNNLFNTMLTKTNQPLGPV